MFEKVCNRGCCHCQLGDGCIGENLIKVRFGRTHKVIKESVIGMTVVIGEEEPWSEKGIIGESFELVREKVKKDWELALLKLMMVTLGGFLIE